MAIRWNYLDRSAGVDGLLRQMDRVLNDFDRGFSQGFGGFLSDSSYGQRAYPPTALIDSNEQLQFLADVPGFAERDIKVTLHQDVLTVSGERTAEAPAGYQVHRQERGALSFSQSFPLASRVDPEATEAKVEDGVLRVSMKKVPEDKPRQIEIRRS